MLRSRLLLLAVLASVSWVPLGGCGSDSGLTGGDGGPGGGDGSIPILGGGDGSGGDGGSLPCVNLCQKQVQCPGGGTTSLSGTVYAPELANPDPVYNAIVYVPNAQVQPFKSGASCDQCGASVSGSPLVTTLTGPDGKFTLANVPVGTNIPVVMQIGRWRRQITIPNVTACTDNPVDAATTRLPRNKGEGDIPLMAVSTGRADALECVLRKMGIDDAEFTLPSADGRIRLYQENGATLAGIPPASALWSSPSELAKYDLVILDCEGSQNDTIGGDKTAQQNVIDYTNLGGRVFASHFSYVWLYNDPPFMGTATWANPPDWGAYQSATGILDVSFPKGQAFAEWLQIVGGLAAPGQIAINNPRHNVDAVIPPAQRWIYTQPPDLQDTGFNSDTIQHFTFNTPIGQDPAKQCGRVVFSSFHVSGNSGGGATFPQECSLPPLTPQEKVLEFMMFDLASCIQNDQQPPVPPPPVK